MTLSYQFTLSSLANDYTGTLSKEKKNFIIFRTKIKTQYAVLHLFTHFALGESSPSVQTQIRVLYGSISFLCPPQYFSIISARVNEVLPVN